MSVQFKIPKKIIYGEHALEDAEEALSMCGSKALIVTDETMIRLNFVDSLIKVLNKNHQDYVLFSKINSEPTDTMILQGKTVFQQNNCDFLIGFGGGAVIDGAKAIALMSRSDVSLSFYMGKEIDASLSPLVAIPTTAGTGSEATRFTIITDTSTQVKMLLKGNSLLPSLAIVDPSFTESSPKSITASCGIDALCHAIEAYISIHAQPLTDIFALSAINRIMSYLIKAYNDPNDTEARKQMSLAALEAGIAFNNSSVTLIHGMSRPIGALFHVPHGLSNAMLLEKCLQFMEKGITHKLAQISRSCKITNSSSEGHAAHDFIQAVVSLLHELQIPSLKEYGIDQNAYYNAIPKMTEDAIQSGSPANTPIPIDRPDIIALYQSIYF